MVRGGEAKSKRNSKRRVNSNEDSDESDEDYVASDVQSDASKDLLEDLAETEDSFSELNDEIDEQIFYDNDNDDGDDDDDFKVIEEEEEEEDKEEEGDDMGANCNDSDVRSEVKRRSLSKTPRKPNKDDEDYEANSDDEDEDDEEFTPNEDDSLDEEEICVPDKRRRSKMDAKPKVEKWGSRKSRKRRKVTVPKKSSRMPARKKPKLNVEFEDDDDIVVRKTTRRGEKKKNISRRKRGSGLDLVTSESSDFEYTISEEEREQVREAGEFCRSSALPERLKQDRPSKCRAPHAIKGKEKVEEVNPKQVCGICFSEEDKRRVRGRLDCCTHYFCFTCIMEWSKVETRCPLCKKRFKAISKPARAATIRDMVVQVPERDQVYQPTEEEIRGYLDPYENVICTECHQGGDDGLMLLCDLCDSPTHTFCVGLGREVPDGNWYCDGCRPVALESDNAQDTSGRAQPVDDGLDLNVVPAPTPSFNQRVVGNLAFPRFPGEINPFSGTGSPTLTRRRILQSHIQRLRSGNRSNPFAGRPNGVSSGANSLGVPPSQTQPVDPNSFINLFGERLLQQNRPPPVRSRDGFYSGQNHPRTELVGGSGFGGFGAMNMTPTHEQLLFQSSSNAARLQDNNFCTAMEQMQSVVRNHLSRLSIDIQLGQDQMKDIVRSATQSILAACGVGKNEAGPVPPPLFCPHPDRRMSGQTSPVMDLCSVCFDDFTRNVVQSMVNSKLPQNQNEWLTLGL